MNETDTWFDRLMDWTDEDGEASLAKMTSRCLLIALAMLAIMGVLGLVILCVMGLLPWWLLAPFSAWAVYRWVRWTLR